MTVVAEIGKSHHVSSRVDKQANTPPLPNPKEPPQLQTQGESKEKHRPVERVSRQEMTLASKGSSNMEPAPVPQTTDKTVSTSTAPPAPSPALNTVKPAGPVPDPDTLRSAHTRPFHADLTPRDRDSVHARPRFRSPDRKPEAPRVQIGQIDVIIESATQSTAKPAPAPSPVDLASRHYLRRL